MLWSGGCTLSTTAARNVVGTGLKGLLCEIGVRAEPGLLNSPANVFAAPRGFSLFAFNVTDFSNKKINSLIAFPTVFCRPAESKWVAHRFVLMHIKKKVREDTVLYQNLVTDYLCIPSVCLLDSCILP